MVTWQVHSALTVALFHCSRFNPQSGRLQGYRPDAEQVGEAQISKPLICFEQETVV